jgi:hypothetical protein
MLNLDRGSTRGFFVQVWRKYRNGETVLEALETLLLEVILEHPEYHHYLEPGNSAEAVAFTPQAGATNPFLHMGMHIALKEQIAADRPAGISELYEGLLQGRYQDTHKLEHRMMECLGQVLWNAQRNNTLPSEADYLDCLRKI